MVRKNRVKIALTLISTAAFALGGCGTSSTGGGSGSATGGQSQNTLESEPSTVGQSDSSGTAEASCVKPTPISFQLNWVQNYNQLPVTVAVDKGWYRNACLNVTIHTGKGSGAAVQNVGTGAADVGIADTLSIIQGQEKGLPVTGVGVQWTQNSFAVVIRKDRVPSGVDKMTPKDLEGMKYAAVPQGSPYVYWQAFVKEQGLNPSTMKEVDVSAPGYQPLVAGSVDFIPNFVGAKNAVESTGVDVVLMKGSDFGQKAYGLAYFANNDWLKDHADVMKEFLRVTARGMVWSSKNPEKAVEILGKYNTAKGQLGAFKGTLELWTLHGASDPQSFLHFDTAGVKSSEDILYDGGVLSGEKFDVVPHWTTQYLPEPSDTYAP